MYVVLSNEVFTYFLGTGISYGVEKKDNILKKIYFHLTFEDALRLNIIFLRTIGTLEDFQSTFLRISQHWKNLRT